MAVKDIRSNVIQNNGFFATVASDTTTAGAIFDTADYELGLMFALGAFNYTDGTYTLLLEESSDAGMAGATVIGSTDPDQLIGTLPVVTAATALGAEFGTVGVISNLRYVRASIVSTGTTTGSDVAVIVTQVAEEMPTSA